MRTRWYGGRVKDRITKRLGDNLDDAGKELAQRIRNAIGVQGPPRSSPGDPPHMDTQVLIASYGHDTDRAALVTRIGSDAPYAPLLEEGAPRLAPRPHVVPTLVVSADDLARIIVQ